MPHPCSVLRQVGLRQSLGQIAAEANFLVVRHKSSKRLAVLQKHKSDVLIVSPINAIGKIACSLCNTHAGFLHKSDYQIIRFDASAQTNTGCIGTNSCNSAILFHGTTSNQTVNANKIRDNYILNGPGFCVEVGGFGGFAQGDEIDANTCYLTEYAYRGYSVGANAQFINVHDNFVYSGNNKVAIGRLEMSGGAEDSKLVNNTIFFQTGYGSTGTPISISTCSGGTCSAGVNDFSTRNIISGNHIYRFQSGLQAITLSSSAGTSGSNINDNTITDNEILWPFGNPGIGIWIQCNNAATACNANTVAHNHIIDGNTTNQTAIQFDFVTGGSMNLNQIVRTTSTVSPTQARIQERASGSRPES